jgi:GNAT superfamily N-acetyltransferase
VRWLATAFEISRHVQISKPSALHLILRVRDCIMSDHPGVFRLRLANPNDIPALCELIDTSVRVLQRDDYSEEQIEGALGTVFGVDTQLLADRTYYVAVSTGADGREILAGCGGWSKRKTLFGSDHGPYRESELLDPQKDAAKIRAFFVHPEWTRRGIATRILRTCEQAARAAGFRKFEMGATLTGVPMYAARGYVEVERFTVPLKNGASLPVVRMAKVLSRP